MTEQAHIDSTPEMVAGVYDRMRRNLEIVRGRLNRPMTLAEKIVLGHLADPAGQSLAAGEAYIQLRPDRVAMQDATAQMALLQFLQSGRKRTSLPSTVHCDHLIRAHVGAYDDLNIARVENSEVYDFLASVSAKYGIGFWRPNSGIIHQVVLENYAFPGGLMIGSDSHTPNAGGLAMVAVGVGGADVADVMAGLSWEVLQPKLIGVKLTGEMSGWVAPKDVILKVAGILTVKGGTNAIVEYFGPGARTISCTGKATITNMGAELGATTSIFQFDRRMELYLRATERAALADLAVTNLDLVAADAEVEEHPERYFHQLIEINLSELEPYVTGPHSPDLTRTISELVEAVQREGYPDNISAALVGSCTNSSYEDIARATSVADQALAHGILMSTPFMITPGSEQVRLTVERDGYLDRLEEVGGKILANACGPCIGQWARDDLTFDSTSSEVKPEPARNSIVTSFNRNFPRRNDGYAATLNFIASPEIVMAYGLAGRLSFNPLTDELRDGEGNPFRLQPPPKAPELPEHGFLRDTRGYVPPADDPATITIIVNPSSERLQLLAPFDPWDGRDFANLPILLKTRGKLTTDHISPAGPWLKYRGHIDNISNNMFVGAVNAFTGETGCARNQLTGTPSEPIPQVARSYKAAGLRWIAVGDENYGEGSSREHAAMSPRYLGAAAIIARSFARIYESNLKKQGVLPLTFANPDDYDLIQEDDKISLVELKDLSPGAPVMGRIRHADGTSDIVELRHTLNDEQVAWFHAGSALNRMKQLEA